MRAVERGSRAAARTLLLVVARRRNRREGRWRSDRTGRSDKIATALQGRYDAASRVRARLRMALRRHGAVVPGASTAASCARRRYRDVGACAHSTRVVETATT